MTPPILHKQNGNSNNYQHQDTPTIQNLVNPPQQDGAAHSHQPVQAPLANKGLAATDGAAVTPATTSQPTVRTTKGKYTLTDFTLQRTLGTGSFGRVHLVQSKHNQRFYAIKVLKKAQVVKMKQVEHTNDERRMLQRVKHPFLITLWGTFQDAKNLYMVMDFVEGGELFSLLRKSQVSMQRHLCSTLQWHCSGTNLIRQAFPQSGCQILRRRSYPRSGLSACAKHHIPRSEARKLASRPTRAR